MKKVYLKRVLVSLFTAVTLCSCNKDENGKDSDPVEVTGLTLDKTEITLAVNTRTTLNATVAPGNATDKTVVWATSDASKVTVDNGAVTAVSEGSATVTATAGGKSATCEVTVITAANIGLDGLTLDNFPVMDGSTSCKHLKTVLACKLMDIPYLWRQPIVDEWTVEYDWNLYEAGSEIRERYTRFFSEKNKSSQTHGAFMSLIDGTADIIMTHRTISPDELDYAVERGVTLLETPVAMDAFVFVVNKDNPVQNLTVEQVRKIYTGEYTNWSQVGGDDGPIMPFTRPRNSGSEEVLREIVMGNLEPANFSEYQIGVMARVFNEIIGDKNAICYTFNNYKELIVRKTDDIVPKIAVNGIFPDETAVRNRTYPFISEVHVAIRSDIDRNSMAYKLYEWLKTDAAKPVYTECGFVTESVAGS